MGDSADCAFFLLLAGPEDKMVKDVRFAHALVCL